MGKQAKERRERSEKRRQQAQAAPEPRPAAPSRWLLAAVGAGGLVIGLAVLWVLARHRSAEPPAPPSRPPARARIPEIEPNDTPEAAQLLDRLPIEVDGRLDAGDRDLFRIRIDEPAGHLIDAWTEGLAGAEIEVMREDGSRIVSVRDPDRVGALGAVKGSLLLRVSAGASGAYRLFVQRSPWVKGLDWEPNDDDPDQAEEMMAAPEPPVGEIASHRVQGWWSRRDDVDCYLLPLHVPAAGAMLRIKLLPPAGVQPKLWVLDTGDKASGIPRKKLAEAMGAAKGDAAILPALGARSWEPSYVVCTAAKLGFAPAVKYTLEAHTYTPSGPFEFEPNDSAATASALPRGVTVKGHLTAGDVDWWRISAGQPGTLRIRFGAPKRAGAKVTLLDDRERELGHVAVARGGAASLDHAAAAFVSVRATDGSDLEDTYTLTVEKPSP